MAGESISYYGRVDRAHLQGIRKHVSKDSEHFKRKVWPYHRWARCQSTLYCGDYFDNNTAVIVPKDAMHLPAIWTFCSSPEFSKAVRRIDPMMSVTNATLVKVPFDLELWQTNSKERWLGLLPEPYSDDPTQWLFQGDPTTSTESLQVAVARLVGYQWPRQDPDEISHLAISDGILPLAPVAGQEPTSERLGHLLSEAFGQDWSAELQAHLLREVGFGTKGLNAWLRDGFFEQHCKLFRQRPFIWHVWDGRRDGFSVLVNYHKLDAANLDKLIYTYLGEWIRTQRAAEASGTPGTNARLVAALELQRKLEDIRDGEPDCDIYVRWKPLYAQPMGWSPDLNDGVRLKHPALRYRRRSPQPGKCELEERPWSGPRWLRTVERRALYLGPEARRQEGKDGMTTVYRTRTFLEALADAIESASSHNRQDQVTPAAVLWTDEARQWEELLPLLKNRLPLFVLGKYAPDEHTGPAYWLRCIIARTIPHPGLPTEKVPVLYLPGYSRQDMRGLETCPVGLQPLAELQYRGVLWSQKNGRDWTVNAFLQSKDGGLGIKVEGDQGTREALQRSLLKLAEEPIEAIHQAAPLRAFYLDGLIHPDNVKNVLRWLNDPRRYRYECSDQEWGSFVALCESYYDFHPDRDSPVTVAEKLGHQYGNWDMVWRRFAEAPASYRVIPDRLREAKPQMTLPLLDLSESWPQNNEAAEIALRVAPAQLV